MIQVPKNIELIYYADHIEFVKDGNPSKPLTLAEKLLCDEVVRKIIELGKVKKGE